MSNVFHSFWFGFPEKIFAVASCPQFYSLAVWRARESRAESGDPLGTGVLGGAGADQGGVKVEEKALPEGRAYTWPQSRRVSGGDFPC